MQVIHLWLDWGEKALTKSIRSQQVRSCRLHHMYVIIHTHDALTRDIIAKVNMSSRHLSILVP